MHATAKVITRTTPVEVAAVDVADDGTVTVAVCPDNGCMAAVSLTVDEARRMAAYMRSCAAEAADYLAGEDVRS